MKRITGFMVLLLLSLLFSACSLFGPKAEVYITVDTIGANLITVKFLAPADNSGSYINKYDSYTQIVSASGYNWHVYEVPAGTYDVYIEWTGGVESNGRARVTIDPDSSANQWAAVYPDASGNVWGEEGGGAFSPGMYYYP